MEKTIVEFSNNANKEIERLSKRVLRLFLIFVEDVEKRGYEAVRNMPRYKDHKLKGRWKDYRSLSLDYSHRVIYYYNNGIIKIIRISKHEYRTKD